MGQCPPLIRYSSSCCGCCWIQPLMTMREHATARSQGQIIHDNYQKLFCETSSSFLRNCHTVCVLFRSSGWIRMSGLFSFVDLFVRIFIRIHPTFPPHQIMEETTERMDPKPMITATVVVIEEGKGADDDSLLLGVSISMVTSKRPSSNSFAVAAPPVEGTNPVIGCKPRNAGTAVVDGAVYDNETFPVQVIRAFPSRASCAVRAVRIASLLFLYTSSMVMSSSASTSTSSGRIRGRPSQINSR
mmetsp:Transcript_41003/g.46287  ORF Transcript_41003/g.46287 Transcript_41003/m.46287 type:complete len:244 (+) Transcript_41003:65-796(+)